MQLTKGKGALFFCFRRDGNQRQRLWLFLQPAVDSVVTQVGSAFTKPTGKRRIAVIKRLRKGRLPVNTPGLLGPELLRFVNRTLIKFAKRHNALLLNLRLTAVCLNDVQVEILIDRHLFQASSVERNLQNALLLASRKLAREIDFELICALSAAVNAMRKPEILYKQPILWHFSVFRGNGFSVSGKRLAITFSGGEIFPQQKKHHCVVKDNARRLIALVAIAGRYVKHAVPRAYRPPLGRSIKTGGEGALKNLLPIIDDFERALQNVRTAEDVEAVKEGVDLIFGKFMGYLSQQGVKPIEAIGKPFNTEEFEAIATIPAPEPDMKGKVLDCVQTGYTLFDKVIRHAKVVVGE